MDDRVWMPVPPASSHSSRSDRRFGEVGGEWFDEVNACKRCGEGDEPRGPRTRELWWVSGEPRQLACALWSHGGSGLFASPALQVVLSQFKGARLVSGRVADHVRDRSSGKPRTELAPAFLETLKAYAELRVAARIPMDVEASSLVFPEGREPCKRCGRFGLTWAPPRPLLVEPDRAVAAINGVEWFELGDTWYPGRGPDIIRRSRDGAGAGGAIFRRGKLGGAEIWRTAQDDSFTLCTSAVRSAVVEAGATNIDFLEVGSIVD